MTDDPERAGSCVHVGFTNTEVIRDEDVLQARTSDRQRTGSPYVPLEPVWAGLECGICATQGPTGWRGFFLLPN